MATLDNSQTIDYQLFAILKKLLIHKVYYLPPFLFLNQKRINLKHSSIIIKLTTLKIKIVVIAIAIGLGLAACQKDTSVESLDVALEASIQAASLNGLSDFILPTSTDFANIPQDPNNLLTQAKVDLGQLLFHETGLALNPMHASSEGTYSCATCHFASAGFQANRHQGISDGGMGFGNNGSVRVASPDYDFSELDVQAIRTPTAMNGAYQKNQLWNGQFGATELNVGTENQWTAGTPKGVNELGYEGLETQAIAGLKVHRMSSIDEFLKEMYQDDFDAAFPEVPEAERCNVENTGLAIAAYERTVLSNQAPFQQWLRGDLNAMTDEEKAGAVLFFGKANCASCHQGPALNSMEFYGLGMGDLFENSDITYGAGRQSVENFGRGGFTKVASDYFKFKVPQLYNLMDSPFYGHGASLTNLTQVVNYKNKAIKENDNVPDIHLALEFIPIDLTNEEMHQLVVFLETALHDPNLQRYEPLEVRSGNCFPANDVEAQVDLGCE
jgi:cytochrome c peroxidase